MLALHNFHLCYAHGYSEGLRIVFETDIKIIKQLQDKV